MNNGKNSRKNKPLLWVIKVVTRYLFFTPIVHYKGTMGVATSKRIIREIRGAKTDYCNRRI